MDKVKTRSMQYSFLITLVGAILMLLMLMLPFAFAEADFKEKLMEEKEEWYLEELEMTNADAVNLSLVEYFKVYSEMAKQGISEDISISCMVIIGVFAGVGVLTLLMSLIKKPIGIIVFDVLTLGVFKIIQFDFEDRGVVPSRSYDMGIVNYLVYVIGILILAGAVWLLVEKRKAKKS